MLFPEGINVYIRWQNVKGICWKAKIADTANAVNGDIASVPWKEWAPAKVKK